MADTNMSFSIKGDVFINIPGEDTASHVYLKPISDKKMHHVPSISCFKAKLIVRVCGLASQQQKQNTVFHEAQALLHWKRDLWICGKSWVSQAVSL